MIALSLGLMLAAGPPPPPPRSVILPELVPPTTRIQVGFLLKYGDRKAEKAAVKAQGKSMSADDLNAYGQSPETIARIQTWLRGLGLTVPNLPAMGQLVVEAEGPASRVQSALGVRLHRIKGKPPAIHALEGKPHLPDWLQPLVMTVTGLDTRPDQPRQRR